MLDDSPHGARDPQIAILRVFAHEDLRQVEANGSSGPNTATTVAGVDPLSLLISREADKMSVEVWARLFTQVLLSSTTGKETSIEHESEMIYYSILCLAGRAAERRHSDCLDEAERIAGRMHAVARRLVDLRPHQAAAHLALGEAYVQMYKNAWRIEDHAAIERYLRLSRDAANQALILDPDNVIARRVSVDRRQRLEELLAQEKETDARNPSARPGMRN